MRRIHNFLLINKKTKKINKKTIIGWKTFNSKKIHLVLPKLKRIINIINDVITKAMIHKQKDIIKQIITILKQEKIYIKMNQMNEQTNKINIYNSFFNNPNKMDEVVTNVKIEEKTSNINDLYNKYLYISKIINNMQKTNVSELILPPQRTTYTVLRSPHADKKAREQFTKGLYNTKMVINQYASIMRYLNKLVYFYTKSFISSYKYKNFY